MYYVYYPYPIRNPIFYQLAFQPEWRHVMPPNFHDEKRQQYLNVDPDLFFKSAGAFKELLGDASVILNKLSEDENLAYQIMEAAQQNNKEKVEELIKSTGVKGTVDVDYNPDGIKLNMLSKVEETDCCKLTMALRWR
ncbi:hypothetical protein ACFSTA_19505 [Ornithinibacillus salinisoli]|uniref:Uncharacterized protein n=1 Tax=Ornithinibacillus salinisoli TaxID=1848459 RepID=A0ABW4W867_9BACI